MAKCWMCNHNEVDNACEMCATCDPERRSVGIVDDLFKDVFIETENDYMCDDACAQHQEQRDLVRS